MKPTKLAFPDQLRQIAELYYPDTCFKLLQLPSRPQHSTLAVANADQRFSFRGYCRLPTSTLAPEDYRRADRDFELFLSSGEHACVALSGWWRSVHIAYLWTPDEAVWVTDNGQVVNRPFPDGLEFEQMAVSFFRLALERQTA